GERRRHPRREAHLPEDGRRGDRRPIDVRRESQGSDARGHGLRPVDDRLVDRRRRRCAPREAHAARLRARRRRRVPDRRGRRGGQDHGGDHLVMSTGMKIDTKEVQRLRAETNAGVMDCKRALEDAQGDFEKAKGLLKERGLASLKKKSGREAKEGTVASYIHAGGRVGAIVEIASETDFVSRSAALPEPR